MLICLINKRFVRLQGEKSGGEEGKEDEQSGNGIFPNRRGLIKRSVLNSSALEGEA